MDTFASIHPTQWAWYVPGGSDPRWHNVFPSSELAPYRRQWPIVPTFMYGGMNYGRIEAPASPGATANGHSGSNGKR